MVADSAPNPPRPAWLLRRLDQLAVAALCIFAVVAMAWYSIAQGGLQGRLIEIDRADARSVNFQVDLNTAEVPELITLPEIGNSLAQRMIEFRNLNGGFKSIDDLRHVKGIGPKIFEKIRPYLLPIPSPTADSPGAP